MRFHNVVGFVAVQGCAFALALAPATLDAQPVTGRADAGGKDSHIFGPAVVGAGQVSQRLPLPLALVDLYTKAGDQVMDPSAVTGPSVSTGVSASDGPLANVDGKGNEAHAFGVTDSLGQETDRVVSVTKTNEGSASAVAAANNGFASANSSLADRVLFERNAPGPLAIQVGLSLRAGSFLSSGANASSSFVDTGLLARADTTLSGLSRLWMLTINLSGDTGILDVAFSSNPILGLPDSLISNALRTAFVFDGSQYSLLSDLDVFSAVLSIPDDFGAVSLFDFAQWGAQAASVPEPSSILLLATGLAFGARLIGRSKQRR